MRDLCLRELAEIVGGKLTLGAMPPLGGQLEPVGRLVTQTSDIRPGDLYWGLCCGELDGSRCAEEAFLRGAAGCVISGRRGVPWGGKYTIEVDDTRWALWQLAKFRRTNFRGTMIAVAGGPGKSLARAMVDTVLRTQQSGQSGPEATHDPATDLALALARLRPHDEYCVLELAAENRGDLAALAHLCRPEIVVALAADRADGACPAAGDPSAAERECCHELFQELPATCLAILPGDEPAWRRRAEAWRVARCWIGRDAGNDLVASDVALSDGKVSFVVDGERVRLSAWGRHLLRPALAAVAVGRKLGLGPRQIAEDLAAFAPLAGRCQVVQTDELTVIDDTCQAQPASFRAALSLLREVNAQGRRVVVCGELDVRPQAAPGDESDTREYEQLGRETVTQGGADLLLACGRGAESLVRGAREAGLAGQQSFACRDVAELESVLAERLDRGDVVLVKGNRKLPLERVVQQLQQRGPKRAA